MIHSLEHLRSSLADRYTIEREIGSGGMATVYLARDVKHPRNVAIKVMHSDISSAVGTERFLREIEVVAAMRHPHILPLYDSGERDGALFYVMPYVEGESLRDRLGRTMQLAVDEALGIAREVADALTYAHARGIVHRDIKPANILLESNHAVVADFGVALVASAAGERMTVTGRASPGTPLYMSPEQASGQRNIDGRSDIYSLGCVLYEMLTGDAPFTGATEHAILSKKMLQPVPSVRIVRDTVTRSLDDAILTALARNAADRFASAGEFARVLEAAAHEQRGVQRNRKEPGLAGERDPVDVEPAPRPHGERSRPAPTPAPAPPVARALGIGVVALTILTGIGFLTTTVYDVKMEIPPDFSASPLLFPYFGARALLPPAIFLFPILVSVVVLKYVLGFVLLGTSRVPGVRRTLDELRSRTSDVWRSLSRTVQPRTAAELYFLASIVVSIIALIPFSDLLVAVTTSTRDTSLLSTPYRSVHHEYTFAMTILIAALAFGWHRVFAYVRARQATGGSIALALWGGLAWMLILVLMTTMPWKLLHHNEHPRARMNGERVYILAEREDDIVLYNADRRMTAYHRGDADGLVRLNTDGYIFETREEFD